MGLMRNALLWASTNPFLAQRLPRTRFVRRASRRFMPGEEPEDALRESKKIAERGPGTILTLLGENIETDAEAAGVAEAYERLLEMIRDRGLPTEISVKPTQLGLDQDPELARRNLERCVVKAQETDTGIVWVDMESSAYVDPTLQLYRAVREKHENVGLCLQAYLYRTDQDVEDLLPLRPSIRLVKGAYLEPEDVAYPKKSDVDEAFMRLTRTLLKASAEGRAKKIGIGTHDPRMIAEAERVAKELGIGGDDWEMEMLFGIGQSEQDRIVRDGTPLKVLISYGAHWFPWYMRRLAERPANVWFVLKQMVG